MEVAALIAQTCAGSCSNVVCSNDNSRWDRRLPTRNQRTLTGARLQPGNASFKNYRRPREIGRPRHAAVVFFHSFCRFPLPGCWRLAWVSRQSGQSVEAQPSRPQPG